MKKLFFALAIAVTMVVMAADVPAVVVNGVKQYGTKSEIVEWELVEDEEGDYYDVVVESAKGVFYIMLDKSGKILSVDKEEDYEEMDQESDL